MVAVWGITFAGNYRVQPLPLQALPFALCQARLKTRRTNRQRAACAYEQTDEQPSRNPRTCRARSARRDARMMSMVRLWAAPLDTH